MGKGREESSRDLRKFKGYEFKGLRGKVLDESSVWTVKLSRMWAGIGIMV